MASEPAASTFDGITWPDYVVIVAYFLFVLAVGLFVSMVTEFGTNIMPTSLSHCMLNTKCKVIIIIGAKYILCLKIVNPDSKFVIT